MAFDIIYDFAAKSHSVNTAFNKEHQQCRTNGIFSRKILYIMDVPACVSCCINELNLRHLQPTLQAKIHRYPASLEIFANMEAELIRTQRELELCQWSLDSVLQDRDQWKNKFLHAQQELFHINGDCARNTYNLSRATDENQRLRNDLALQQALVAELAAKNAHLQEQNSADRVELEEMVVTFQRTLAETAGSLAPATHAQLEELHAQIDDLQRKNHFLQALSHEDENCTQHTIRVFEQLQDANNLQAAAEAETEGLRHLEAQNKILQEAHVADAKRIADLIVANAELEGEASGKPLTSASSHEDLHDAALSLEAELCAHGISSSVLASVLASSTAGLMSSQPTPPALYGRSPPPASPANGINNPPSLPPRIAVSAHRPVALALSTVQTVAVSPVPQYTPTQLMVTSRSVREEIQAAATAPISRFSQQLPTIHEDSKSPLELSNQTSEKTPNTPDPGKLNVALTVNINAGDRKGWKLLSRVQSVISRFSTLDIHGPRDLVREFVQDMERVEAVHKQVVANAARWENIATEELHQVDALQAQLRDRPRCTDPVHKNLEDELEANEARNLMQERLLAEWRKGSDV